MSDARPRVARGEQQAAFELLRKAAGGEELLEQQRLTVVAKRLAVRMATFRYLLTCRVLEPHRHHAPYGDARPRVG